MTTKDIYSQSEHHMKRSIETLKENLMKIRTVALIPVCSNTSPSITTAADSDFSGSPARFG